MAPVASARHPLSPVVSLLRSTGSSICSAAAVRRRPRGGAACGRRCAWLGRSREPDRRYWSPGRFGSPRWRRSARRLAPPPRARGRADDRAGGATCPRDAIGGTANIRAAIVSRRRAIRLQSSAGQNPRKGREVPRQQPPSSLSRRSIRSTPWARPAGREGRSRSAPGRRLPRPSPGVVTWGAGRAARAAGAVAPAPPMPRRTGRSGTGGGEGRARRPPWHGNHGKQR